MRNDVKPSIVVCCLVFIVSCFIPKWRFRLQTWHIRIMLFFLHKPHLEFAFNSACVPLVAKVKSLYIFFNCITTKTQLMQGNVPWRGAHEQSHDNLQLLIEVSTRLGDVVLDAYASMGKTNLSTSYFMFWVSVPSSIHRPLWHQSFFVLHAHQVMLVDVVVNTLLDLRKTSPFMMPYPPLCMIQHHHLW